MYIHFGTRVRLFTTHAFATVAVLVVLVGLTCSSSSAAVIPSLLDIAPTGANTTFFYTLALSPGTTLDPTHMINNVLVIYDFDGYVLGSAGSVSGNWLVTTMDKGPAGQYSAGNSTSSYPTFPLGSDPVDGPLVNLVFTYVGPVRFGAEDDFDFLFADSTLSTYTLGIFRAQALKTVSGPDASHETNTAVGTVGYLDVPSALGPYGSPAAGQGESMGVPGAVPEPGSVVLLGSALLALTVYSRWYRHQTK